jgi:hypothetical protein
MYESRANSSITHHRNTSILYHSSFYMENAQKVIGWLVSIPLIILFSPLLAIMFIFFPYSFQEKHWR